MQQGRDAEHHRQRAEELRAAAAQMTDHPIKRNLLKLAAEYDAMAERNVAHDNGGEPTY